MGGGGCRKDYFYVLVLRLCCYVTYGVMLAFVMVLLEQYIVQFMPMANGHGPPSLPIAVMVQVDKSYRGPSFFKEIPNLVPIPPYSSISESLGSNYARMQFPLKLA